MIIIISYFVAFQIARRLLGKLLIDLRNTREEAISVAELKSSQDQVSKSTKTEKEDKDYPPKLFIKADDTRRSSTTSDISMDQDDDDDKETQYRLDPKLISELLSYISFTSMEFASLQFPCFLSGMQMSRHLNATSGRAFTLHLYV